MQSDVGLLWFPASWERHVWSSSKLPASCSLQTGPYLAATSKASIPTLYFDRSTSHQDGVTHNCTSYTLSQLTVNRLCLTDSMLENWSQCTQRVNQQLTLTDPLRRNGKSFKQKHLQCKLYSCMQYRHKYKHCIEKPKQKPILILYCPTQSI